MSKWHILGWPIFGPLKKPVYMYMKKIHTVENGQEEKKIFFSCCTFTFSIFQSVILLDDSSHLCNINRLPEDMDLDCYLLEIEKPLVFKSGWDWQ